MTVELLREKIARLQGSLDDVSAALEELGAGVDPSTSSAAKMPRTTEPTIDPLAGVRFSDPEQLRPVLDRAFTEMGIDTSGPVLTPREVQALMVRQGVRPADKLGSSAVIEARER
jgi:hypothetical protein